MNVVLRVKVPVNNFSHFGTEPPLPGYQPVFGGVDMSFTGTQGLSIWSLLSIYHANFA